MTGSLRHLCVTYPGSAAKTGSPFDNTVIPGAGLWQGADGNSMDQSGLFFFLFGESIPPAERSPTATSETIDDAILVIAYDRPCSGGTDRDSI